MAVFGGGEAVNHVVAGSASTAQRRAGPTHETADLAGTSASILIALLDTVAIALVLPLVNAAVGSGAESGTTAFVSHVLGDPKPAVLALILTVLVVSIFILKDLAAIAYTWWLAGFKAFKHVELSSRLLRMFLASPYTQVSGRSSSEMMRTMSEASAQVYGTVVFGLMTSVANVATIVAIMAALLISAPLPALAAVHTSACLPTSTSG